MSKDKHETTPPSPTATEDVLFGLPAPANVAPVVVDEGESPHPTPETTPPSPTATKPTHVGPRVFEVEIPGCLLGKRVYVAKDEADAYARYKATGGITSHIKQQVVVELSPDCPAYATAVEDKRKSDERDAAAKKARREGK